MRSPLPRGSRWTSNGKLITPDLSGLSMRDALVTLEGAGLGVRISGSGRVIQQIPKAGRSLKPGDSVEVVLQPSIPSLSFPTIFPPPDPEGRMRWCRGQSPRLAAIERT